jgi:hypothetical protein
MGLGGDWEWPWSPLKLPKKNKKIKKVKNKKVNVFFAN